MTYDEFIAEYRKVSARAVYLSEKSRREGLLAIEDGIDTEKENQRDIIEYGLRLTVDGTDNSVIRDILENIIRQEEDKYTRLLMEIKKEAVLSIQSGENSRITVYRLNSFTNMDLTEDPILQKYMNKSGETGTFSEDELDALIGGKK